MFNSRKWRTVTTVSLVGTGSFFLGGLMVYTLSNPPKESNKIVLQPLPPDPATIRKDVYASIHGTTYYPWWCDAGKTIIKKNIIWYETPEEAKKAGYRITKRCR